MEVWRSDEYGFEEGWNGDLAFCGLGEDGE